MQVGSGAQAEPGGGEGKAARTGNGPWQEETVVFRVGAETKRSRAGAVLRQVYRALEEKGYDPVSQLVGYLLSGDPTYITSYAGARSLVRSVERDELLEELLHTFMHVQGSAGGKKNGGGAAEPR
ncbi:MAG: IreB family regulatory phosphoprotein [Limnochordaceae bacterium]|nr:IreB family regulatory phosphoprotein [Limnochordaceae bacterium]